VITITGPNHHLGEIIMANKICLPLQEAKKNNELTYFTGLPCKNGHVSLRRTSNGLCIQCGKEIHGPNDRNNYRYKNTFARQFAARKQNAIRNGIPFTIELFEIEQPKFCPIFGLELNYGWSGERCRDDAKATFDKVIPSLGYVPGNVFVISWRANKLKNDMSLDELEKIMKYIKEKTNVQDV